MTARDHHLLHELEATPACEKHEVVVKRNKILKDTPPEELVECIMSPHILEHPQNLSRAGGQCGGMQAACSRKYRLVSEKVIGQLRDDPRMNGEYRLGQLGNGPVNAVQSAPPTH